MSERDELEQEVEHALAAALPEVDLRELVVMRRGGTLRAVVDHPEGVDHGLCARVTEALAGAGLLERFTIEVWSPGPEPPLRTERHFQGAVGSRVRLEVDDPSVPRGRRARNGRLVAADAHALTLEAGGAEGTVTIDRASVRRARIAEPTAHERGAPPSAPERQNHRHDHETEPPRGFWREHQ